MHATQSAYVLAAVNREKIDAKLKALPRDWTDEECAEWDAACTLQVATEDAMIDWALSHAAKHPEFADLAPVIERGRKSVIHRQKLVTLCLRLHA